MPTKPTPDAGRIVKVPGHPGIFKKGSRYYDTWKERGRPRKEGVQDAHRGRGRAQRIADGGAAPSRERFDRYAERWLIEYQGRSSRPISDRTRER